MGKNHRHQKQLKSEKAKTKLKTTKTKFLPKGLNVTDTTFKVRQIVLPQQLREQSDNEPLSRRKLNVSELISRMNHYNDKIKTEACEELSFLLKTAGQEVVDNHVVSILPPLSGLIQSKDRKTRRAAVKTIGNLLDFVNEEKIRPFFNYLSMNLRCAMTHIDKNIQEDSLLLMDVLLDKLPALVAQNSDKILTNFFPLIAKLREDSSLSKQMLTVNLNSQITSVKWRIEVVARLRRLFQAIFQFNQNQNDLTTNFLEVNCAIGGIELLKSFQEVDECKVEETSCGLNRHVISLIPLLFECWMEVLPEKTSNKQEITILKEEQSAILSQILHVLYLLYEYLHNLKVNLNDVFSLQDGVKFFAYLIRDFPYTCPGGSNSGSSGKFVTENMLIMYLTGVLVVPRKKQNEMKLEKTCILSYLKKCLSLNLINEQNVSYLIKILRIIFVEDSKNWRQNGSEITSLFNACKTFYYESSANERIKSEMFHLIMDLYYVPGFENSAGIQEWLAFLPNLLLKPQIYKSTLQKLLELSRRKCFQFQQAFLFIAPKIFENLKTLRIPDAEDELQAKKLLLSIVYYNDLLPKAYKNNFSEVTSQNDPKFGQDAHLLLSI